MAKTIIIGGYGPGISKAIAEKFGGEGFSVALVARNEERLAAGVAELAAKGIKAVAFPTDLADPAAVRRLVGRVKEALGPVTVVQWNAYGNAGGDLTTADSAEVSGLFDIAIGGLVAVVQAAVPDLQKEKDAAILVTNGGLGLPAPENDRDAVAWGTMGLAVANAAKSKLVGVLSEKLKKTGIYVGQVFVLGAVKGTAWDQGSATIEASDVAEKFWTLYRSRTDVSAQVG